MKTLRKIDSQDIESNFDLGENYTVISRYYQKNAGIFNRSLKDYFSLKESEELSEDEKKDAENIIGFVFKEFGQSIPLLKGNRYYVMGETGQTFDTLHNKL